MITLLPCPSLSIFILLFLWCCSFNFKSIDLMVFFVCETCNETLKKNQVQKHVLKCRQCNAVTCVDCSVTFYGDDFEAHTTCISEAEKYEKSLHVAKKVKVNPQDLWICTIEKAVENCKSAPFEIQTHLQRIQEFSNIPRNKNKFINFCKNSLRLFQEPVATKLWDYLDTFRTNVPVVDSKASIVEEPKSEETNTKETKKRDKVSTIEGEISDGDDEKKKKKAKKEKKKEAEVVKGVEVEAVEEQSERKKSKKDKKKRKKEVETIEPLDE
mmetsp:Transcript_7868/g.11759  ORF Transcript_7868/g.11759 Transcript_7868/m.11759 type:complete len:270 (+) Transcript_7868:1221-2030(+)